MNLLAGLIRFVSLFFIVAFVILLSTGSLPLAIEQKVMLGGILGVIYLISEAIQRLTKKK